MAKTISYKDKMIDGRGGFPSFHSFIPEWMIGMNNSFYSFKAGNLWKHDSPSVNRNSFYGQQYNTKVTGVFNDNPIVNKLWKTLILEADDAWETTMQSDQQVGHIEKEWYVNKEGAWISHIRNTEVTSDFKLRSANGIGSNVSVDSSTPSAVTVQFPSTFNLGSIISIGDLLYYGTATPVFAGVVTNVDNPDQIITVDTTVIGGSVPTGATFMMYVKNGIAESHGVLGHYCKFTLVNNSTSKSEIFAIRSEVMKSFP